MLRFFPDWQRTRKLVRCCQGSSQTNLPGEKSAHLPQRPPVKCSWTPSKGHHWDVANLQNTIRPALPMEDTSSEEDDHTSVLCLLPPLSSGQSSPPVLPRQVRLAEQTRFHRAPSLYAAPTDMLRRERRNPGRHQSRPRAQRAP